MTESGLASNRLGFATPRPPMVPITRLIHPMQSISIALGLKLDGAVTVDFASRFVAGSDPEARCSSEVKSSLEIESSGTSLFCQPSPPPTRLSHMPTSLAISLA